MFCWVAKSPFEELVKWANHYFPGNDLIQDDEKLQPFADEFVEYFQGKINRFTIPIFYHGTPFQEAVWKALCDIPYGQTRSYSDIAQQIQNRLQFGPLGGLLSRTQSSLLFHAIVLSEKWIANGLSWHGMEMKTQLLELERGFTNSGKELQHV